MKGFKDKTSAPATVAVLRALPGLGDLLCAIPALRALRAALPDARISLLGLPQAAFLLERFPQYLDELIDFPGFPGLPERKVRVEGLPDFFRQMQERDFDLVLQLHGSGIVTNAAAILLGGRRSAGFHLPGQYRPNPDFIAWPEGEAEIRRLLRLTEHLGFADRGESLEFPLLPADRQALAGIPQAKGLRAGGYACLHPGASVDARRWAPRHFARLGDEMARHGLQVVLTGSPAEAGLTAQMAAAMTSPALDLAGATSLGALAALIAGARLMACNDTGVSHLAAALGTPSVVIFSATPPERWAPLDRRLHRVVDCRAAGFTLETSIPDDSPLEDALRQARGLLEEEFSHAAC